MADETKFNAQDLFGDFRPTQAIPTEQGEIDPTAKDLFEGYEPLDNQARDLFEPISPHAQPSMFEPGKAAVEGLKQLPKTFAQIPRAMDEVRREIFDFAGISKETQDKLKKFTDVTDVAQKPGEWLFKALEFGEKRGYWDPDAGYQKRLDEKALSTKYTESLIQMVPQTVLNYAAGFVGGHLGVSASAGGQIFGGSYLKFRDQLKHRPTEAAVLALADTAIQLPVEVLATTAVLKGAKGLFSFGKKTPIVGKLMDNIVKGLAKKFPKGGEKLAAFLESYAGRLLTGGGAEGLEEFTQSLSEIVTEMASKAMKGEEITGDWLYETFKEKVSDGLWAAAIAFPIGGGSASFQKFAQSMAQDPEQRKKDDPENVAGENPDPQSDAPQDPGYMDPKSIMQRAFDRVVEAQAAAQETIQETPPPIPGTDAGFQETGQETPPPIPDQPKQRPVTSQYTVDADTDNEMLPGSLQITVTDPESPVYKSTFYSKPGEERETIAKAERTAKEQLEKYGPTMLKKFADAASKAETEEEREAALQKFTDYWMDFPDARPSWASRTMVPESAKTEYADLVYSTVYEESQKELRRLSGETIIEESAAVAEAKATAERSVQAKAGYSVTRKFGDDWMSQTPYDKLTDVEKAYKSLIEGFFKRPVFFVDVKPEVMEDENVHFTGTRESNTGAMVMNRINRTGVLGGIWHELTHDMGRTNRHLWKQLKSFIIENQNTIEYLKKVEQTAFLYNESNPNLILDEVVAYFVDSVMSKEGANEKLLEKLQKEKPNVYIRLLKEVKKVLQRLKDFMRVRLDEYRDYSLIVNDIDAAIEKVTDILAQHAKEYKGIWSKQTSEIVLPKTPAKTPKINEQVLQKDLDRNRDFFSKFQAFMNVAELPKKAPAQKWRDLIATWANKGKFKSKESEWMGILDWLDNYPQKRDAKAKIDEAVANKSFPPELENKRIAVQDLWHKWDTTYSKSNDQEMEDMRRKFLDEIAKFQEEAEAWAFKSLSKIVTKEQVLNYIEENVVDIVPFHMAEDKLLPGVQAAAKPKYGREALNVPGGYGYQEILLTIPNYRPAFEHQHWSPHKNVVAFSRFDERVVDGKAVLFMQELQSDWHQIGRKKGYKGEKLMLGGKVDAYTPVGYSWQKAAKGGVIQHQLVEDATGEVKGSAPLKKDAIRAAGFKQEDMVPDAPFKSDWLDLILKKMVKVASERKFDYIAVVNGQMVKERYNLQRWINSVEWSLEYNINPNDSRADVGGRLRVKDKADAPIHSISVKNTSDVSDIIGDELTAKLIEKRQAAIELAKQYKVYEEPGEYMYPGHSWVAQPPFGEKPIRVKFRTENDAWNFVADRVTMQSKTRPYLEGLDLATGGEWANNLYDEKVPNRLNALFGKKKWGKPKAFKSTLGRDFSVEGKPVGQVLYKGVDVTNDPVGEVLIDYEGEDWEFMLEELEDEVLGTTLAQGDRLTDETPLDRLNKWERVLNELKTGDWTDVEFVLEEPEKVTFFPITKEMWGDTAPSDATEDWWVIYDNENKEVYRAKEKYDARYEYEERLELGEDLNPPKLVKVPVEARVGIGMQPVFQKEIKPLDSGNLEERPILESIGKGVPKHADIIRGILKTTWNIDDESVRGSAELYNQVLESVGAEQGLAVGAKESGSGSPEVQAYVNQAWETYEAGSRSTSKGALIPHKNVIVRPKGVKSGKGRQLLVQISSNVRHRETTSLGDAYFDKLYSKRQGYDRPVDFWEVPEWIGRIAKFAPNADAYVVRNLEEAKVFFENADYDHVMFSSMDDNRDFVKEVASSVKKGKVHLGGYADKKYFKGVGTWHDTLEEMAADIGAKFEVGVDYRHFAGTRTIPRLELSKGCNHRCAFCVVDKNLKMASDEQIDDQIKNFGKLDYRLVYLNDKTFGQAGNHERLAEIGDRLKAANPKFEGFIIQTTAPQFLKMDETFLRNSRIKYVELGCESYNDDILRNVNKPHNTKLIDKAVERIRELNMNFVPNLMVGLAGVKNGKLWSETAKTYGNTLRFLRKNNDVISHVNIYVLATFEGSDLHNQLGATDTDLDQNVVKKSWMKSQKLHEKFYHDVLQFGSRQLDKGEIKRITEQDPLQKDLALFHGTGAKFKKFNMDFIGTGEGAQLFGYGIYLTQSPGIGEGYANKIGGKNLKTIAGKSLRPKKSKAFGVVFTSNLFEIFSAKRNIRKYVKKISSGKGRVPHAWRTGDLDSFLGKYNYEHFLGQFTQAISRFPNHESVRKEIRSEIRAGNARGKKVPRFPNGYEFALVVLDNMYRDKILEDDSGPMLYQAEYTGDKKFLNWYDNLSREDIARIGINEKYYGVMTGSTIYDLTAHRLKSKRKASQFLYERGYAGIRYPIDTIHGDAVKSEAKHDRHNYVFFSDEDLKIVKAGQSRKRLRPIDDIVFQKDMAALEETRAFEYLKYNIDEIAEKAGGYSQNKLVSWLRKQETLGNFGEYRVSDELIRKAESLSKKFSDRKVLNKWKKMLQLRRDIASGKKNPTLPAVQAEMQEFSELKPYTIRHTGKNFYIGQNMRYGEFNMSDQIFGGEVEKVVKRESVDPVTNRPVSIDKVYDRTGKRLIKAKIFSQDPAVRIDEIKALVKQNIRFSNWYQAWKDFMWQFVDKGVPEVELKRIVAISGLLGAGKSPDMQQKIWAKTIKELDTGKRITQVAANEKKKVEDIWAGKYDQLLKMENPGDMDSVLQTFGRKIGPYLMAAMDPKSPDVLVLDRHMPKLWGYNILLTARGAQGGFNLDPTVEAEITKDIVQVAEEMNLTVAGVQAALWFEARTPNLDETRIDRIAQANPSENLPLVFWRKTLPIEEVKDVAFIHYKKKKLDIGDFVFGASADGKIAYNRYSMKDIGERIARSTEAWPYEPVVYMYQRGQKHERNVAQGRSAYTFKFNPNEIYDGLNDPLNYWERAFEESKKDPQAHLINIYLNIVRRQPQYKGTLVPSPSDSKVPWMLIFEKVAVQDYPTLTNVGISDMVQGVDIEYKTAEEAVKDMPKRSYLLGRFIKSLIKPEQYQEISLDYYSPSIARFQMETEGTIELSTAMTIKGPLRTARAMLSQAGISRGQRLVYMVHEPRPDNSYPAYVDYSEAKQFIFKVKGYGPDDAAKLIKDLEKDGLTDFNVARIPAGFLAIEQLAFGDSDYKQLVDILEKYADKSHNANVLRDVHSESLGHSDRELSDDKYKEAIVSYWGKTKGEKIYEEALKERDRYLKEVRTGAYQERVVEGRKTGARKGGYKDLSGGGKIYDPNLQKAIKRPQDYTWYRGNDSGILRSQRQATYFSIDEDYARDYGMSVKKFRIANLDRTWNPFDIASMDIDIMEMMEDHQEFPHDVEAYMGKSSTELEIQGKKYGDWIVLEDPKIVKAMKERGYDSYITSEYSTSLAIYNDKVKGRVIDEGFISEEDEAFAAEFRALNNLPDPMQRPIDLTDEQKEVLDKIGRKDVSIVDKVKESLEYKPGKFVTAVADKLHPLAAAAGGESTGYMMHRGLPGVQSTINAMMEHGKLRLHESGVTTIDTRKEGFVPWLRDRLGASQDKFFYWLIANRDAAREKRDKKYTPMFTPEERSVLLNWSGNRTDKGVPFVVINKEFQEWNNSILKLGIDTGLLDPAMVAQFKDQFYIPFYRIFEDEEATAEFIKAPVNTKKIIAAQIKKLRGSKRKIGDPLENILANWSHLIKQSMANLSRKEAFNNLNDNNVMISEGIRAVEEVSWKDTVIFKKGSGGTTFVYQKEGVEVLGFKDNGKTRFFKVNDAELFQALSMTNQRTLPRWLAVILGAPKALLTFGATVTPSFIASNTTRDTLHTFTISKGFLPFIDTMRGFIKTIAQDQDYIEYVASGNAFVGSYIKSDRPEVFSKFAKKIVKREGQGALGKILDSPMKIWRFWETFTEASENATRLALYKNMKKQGKTQLEAAFAARDIMDFQKKGASAVVQYLTATVPFLNARIQGLHRMAQAMKQDPKMYALKGGIVAMASLALWALYADDDRYKELEDWEKFAYYHFWIGKHHFRIPKPFETGVIWSSLWTASADVIKGNEEVSHLMRFLGVSMLDTFAFNPIPQAVKPILELYFNTNMFTGRPIVPEGFRYKPAEERYYPWDSEAARILGGILKVSPRQIQHLMRGYMAGFGSGLLGGADMMARYFGDFPERPEATIDSYPLIGRFVRPELTRNTKYNTRFYEIFEDLNELSNRIKIAERDGDFPSVHKLRKENRMKLSAHTRAKEVKRKLANTRKKVHEVWNRKDLTAKQKRKELDRLQAESNKETKEFYEWYKSQVDR